MRSNSIGCLSNHFSPLLDASFLLVGRTSDGLMIHCPHLPFLQVKRTLAMYVARAPRHPRCRASRLLFALCFLDSSSLRRGPPTDGRRKHCGTSPLPTPAHALRLLYSIPLHVNGTAGSRITPLGSPPHGGSYLSRPSRFLLDRRSPDHGTDDRAPSAGACWRRGGVCAALAALALQLAAPERPLSRNVGRTPDVQPSGVEARGRAALRR